MALERAREPGREIDDALLGRLGCIHVSEAESAPDAYGPLAKIEVAGFQCERLAGGPRWRAP
jgi:hypothetical protein